jgi:hypothetical protein
VFNGRCKVHAVWPTSRLKALVIAERGERCEVLGCEAVAPIELHHLNGVEDNRPEALELRCRLHNPRGTPTHKR